MGTLTALAFHPDGDFIVTAGSDNTVRLWEVPANLRRARKSLFDADESIYFDADLK
jgi:WD40 repeat protein